MRLLARRLCDRLRHPHDNVWHFINAALVILVLALLARDYNYQSQFSAPQPESVLDVVARSGVLRVGSRSTTRRSRGRAAARRSAATSTSRAGSPTS